MNDSLPLDLNKRYTYADYLTWSDGRRCELVDGLIKPTPTPRPIHQRIAGNLLITLDKAIQTHKKKCEIYIAPVDVCLPKNGETADNKIYDVVQPDLFIVCDPSKIEERCCLGIPDFVAEVQWWTTSSYDLIEKFNLYEAFGVREYWALFSDGWLNVFILQPDGKYNSDPILYYKDQKAPVQILDGVEIDLTEVFDL
jgi:Uma2 family endonuclease